MTSQCFSCIALACSRCSADRKNRAASGIPKFAHGTGRGSTSGHREHRPYWIAGPRAFRRRSRRAAGVRRCPRRCARMIPEILVFDRGPDLGMENLTKHDLRSPPAHTQASKLRRDEPMACSRQGIVTRSDDEDDGTETGYTPSSNEDPHATPSSSEGATGDQISPVSRNFSAMAASPTF